MRNACKCYNTDVWNEKHLKFLWTSNTKYGVMNIFWNLYEIGLWRSISAKIDLRKQTSQILMFQYPRQTQNDIPGTKVTSKRRAIVFEGFFGGPKNWTGDIGHSAITTPPTRQGRAYQTKSCIKCFWKCHNTKFNFNLDIDLLFECSILTKKRFIKSEMYVTVGSSRSTVWMVLMKLNCVKQEKCQPQV